MAKAETDEGTGCLAVIGAVAISIGCGYLWGRGVGWIALGLCCLIIVAINVAFTVATNPKAPKHDL